MGKKIFFLPHDFQNPIKTGLKTGSKTGSKTGIGGRCTCVPSTTVSND